MGKDITVIPGKMDTKAEYSHNTPIYGIHGKEKIRVAAYCRVSTEIEDQLNSYENQVEYYTEYINENPDFVLVGIYGDEGKSATGNKWRKEFNKMIEDCRKGKIDMVITKSISRFARNTQDCLQFSRELKELGIPIFFEKENINSMDSKGELLFTILSSLAQEESRNISENVTWAYETLFQQGKVVVNAKRFLGYDKNDDGILIINKEQAVLVRRIYREFLSGYTVTQIAKGMNRDGIPGIYGKPRWSGQTINQILTNEKYKGDLLLQKTYVPDYLSKRSVENTGQKQQYYVENDHEAIIPRGEWEAVQLELERRQKFRANHDIKCVRYSENLDPFQGKVICGECGHVYIAHLKEDMWCKVAEKKRMCSNRIVARKSLQEDFVRAWEVMSEGITPLKIKWEAMLKNGNPLEQLRAKQMLAVCERKLMDFDVELALLVLEQIIIRKNGSIKFCFLDGTTIEL